jgi:hypothetical protein
MVDDLWLWKQECPDSSPDAFIFSNTDGGFMDTGNYRNRTLTPLAEKLVETPVDSEFCSARKSIQSQVAQHGFRLDAEHGGELPQALPAEIVGMAFKDFEHNRGSGQVATLWELHPATVDLLR